MKTIRMTTALLLVLAFATAAIASEDEAWLQSKSTKASNKLWEQVVLADGMRGIRVEADILSEQAGMLSEIMSLSEPSGLFAFAGLDDPDPGDRDSDEDKADREEDIYDDGTSSLDDRNWEEAVREFEKVINMNGRRKDAAMYWKALALYKLEHRLEALETLEELKTSDYTKSRWRKDAKALEMEIRQKSGEWFAPEDEEDNELKMMALNSLMHSDPDRAVPLLEKVLKGNNSFAVKERALFVLSQSDSPEARALFEKTASDDSDAELQMKALEYLGLFGGGEYTGLLEKIYKGTTSTRIKRKIIDSYWLSSEHDYLIAIAKSEDDIDLRSTAMSKIALMGDGEALRDLYVIEKNPDIKKDLIGYFILTGDKEILVGIAKDEKNPELLEKAISQLGVMGGEDELWILYETNPPVKIREQILGGIWLSGGVGHLIEVARTDSEPELRQEAISKLGLMGADEAREALTGLYADEDDYDVKETILNALWLQGNDVGLIDIARTEKDRKLRKEAIEKLSLMGSDKATDFMIELLED